MSGFASLLDQFKQTTQQTSRVPSSLSSSSTARAPSKPTMTYTPPTIPVRRILIACPVLETGGPEALHQLCHVINSGGYQYQVEEINSNESAVDEFGREIKKDQVAKKGSVKAYMLYMNERHGSITVAEEASRPPKYFQYVAPAVNALPTDGIVGTDGYCSDLVIWPEIWTKYMDALQRDGALNKKYQIAIWWLSVDNNRGAFSPKDFQERCDVLHLVQSYYARRYVTSNIVGKKQQQVVNGQAKVLDLTEFIPHANKFAAGNEADTLENGSSDETIKQSTRDLDVVYNPLKGMHYTDEIIRRSGVKRARNADGVGVTSGVQFTPIGGGEGGKVRISGEEVVALLKRAKVYIDFGHHPGMDRLPREAALAGCVVLTNQEGAAKYQEDVPLPSDLKFEEFDADKIYSLLRDICADSIKFDEYSGKMQTYKNWILGQELRMRVCVDRLIEEIVTTRCDKTYTDI